nr:MAG TPA_asm: hypothetical protein [Microviridae sp.]
MLASKCNFFWSLYDLRSLRNSSMKINSAM